jgi:DNA invertase Pin-like site-specific DNA recombinase
VADSAADRPRLLSLHKLDVQTHGGEISDLTANILASVAQEEARRLGERVRATWQLITAQGWYKTAAPAWGYRWRERTPRGTHERSPEDRPGS